MKVKYSRKIDKRVIAEVNKECPRLSKVMGFKFEKEIRFDKRFISIAKAVAKSSRVFINETKIREAMKAIYGKDIPKITIYVNTTEFGTWNVIEGWVSVSMKYYGESFFNHTCHEINHFMYDSVYGTNKYEDTNIKEIVTIFNNNFGIKDTGWTIFKDERNKIANEYQSTNKDFKDIIRNIKKNNE